MRKVVIALSALAALGLSIPMTSAVKAEEAKVVIKSGDRDHEGREHREHHRKVVVIKKKHHDHDRKVVVVKKHRDGDHD